MVLCMFTHVCMYVCMVEEASSGSVSVRSPLVGPLVEVLGCLDPAAQPDAVVYCMGAVKLLCSNSDLRTELVTCGAVRTIAGLLKKLSEVRTYIRTL